MATRPAVRFPPSSLALAGLAGAHLVVTAALGRLRFEHVLVDLALVALALGPRRVRGLAPIVLPLWLTGAIYDNLQLLLPWRGAVHVADLYDAELRLFGLAGPDGAPVIPATAAQALASAPLDLLTGAAYIAYLYVPIALVLWWTLRGDADRARALAWAFLLVNVAGYAVQLLYPAAPPWYVARYGLGPAVLDAAPDAAGAARFDALLGIDYFAGWYRRSTNVFGAMPSLHSALPVISAMAALGLGARVVLPLLAFAGLVAFSAVYLNHHYVLDVLAGVALALVASAVVRRAMRPRPAVARAASGDLPAAVTR